MATKTQSDLNALVDTATALLNTLHAATLAISTASPPPPQQRPPPPSSSSSPSVDALALARDAAALIKAHATKLSLLIINTPFTPSAIHTILSALVSGPVPALAAAAQTCAAHTHTLVVRRELAWRCAAVLAELRGLLAKIPRDGRVLPEEERVGVARGNRGSVTATGVLWAAADEVARVAEIGVGGVLVEKVREWRDTVRDVMEELKEWGEEEDDNDDEDDEDDDDDAGSEGDAQDLLDKLMSSHRAIPRTDPNGLRPRLDLALRNLGLTTHLYQAITKRRLATLPHNGTPLTPETSARIDSGLRSLARVPEVCGDLAGAFYDLDAGEVDRVLGECVGVAVEAARAVERTWEGGEDGFTAWAGRFVVEIRARSGKVEDGI